MTMGAKNGRTETISVRVYDPEKARMASNRRWSAEAPKRAQKRIDDLVRILATGRITPEQQRQLAELAARQ